MKYGKWSLDGCRVDLNKHNGTPSNVRETNQYKQLMALTLFTTQRNNLETLTRARTSCSVSRDVTSRSSVGAATEGATGTQRNREQSESESTARDVTTRYTDDYVHNIA